MGLIKAAMGAVGGVLADQWREFFYCDAIPADILVCKGEKRTSGRSANKRGEPNIISDGSVIAVADGQCMIIVDQGKVVELCAEPGEFVYDMSSEPSLFSGELNQAAINETFATIGKRFSFGGDTGKDQRVYYFNTKELMGNKYGTPSPVPFRVVDQRAGIDMDISIRCFGEYSYRLVDPILFYTNVCGNVEQAYSRSEIEGQLKSEVMTALQPAFAKISAMGIRYSALPGHTQELAQAMNDVLSEKWKNLRGIQIVSFGVSSVNASEEDEKMLKELQRNVAFTDPNRAAAHLVGAQAAAMQAAASNSNAGATAAFMGMGMAGAMGGFGGDFGGFGGAKFKRKIEPDGQSADSWTCACGHSNQGKFCAECGKPKPRPEGSWICSACGETNVTHFCGNCGRQKPSSDGWSCTACGTKNKGRFCVNCGKSKPAGMPLYKCDKCGWEPEDPYNPPKFCPECGDIFDERDIQSEK